MTVWSGLNHLSKDGQWRAFTPDNSDYPEGPCGSVAADGVGGVWVGSISWVISMHFYWDGGLAHLMADGTWEVYDPNSVLPGNDVYSITPDGKGGVWFDTGFGIAHLTFGDPTAPAAPIASQSVYQEGDRLLITLPDLPLGKYQYLAALLPGPMLYVIPSLNHLAPYNGYGIPQWTGEKSVVDLQVPSGFPKGSYVVFLIRMTVETNPVGNQQNWELGSMVFEIQ